MGKLRNLMDDAPPHQIKAKNDASPNEAPPEVMPTCKPTLMEPTDQNANESDGIVINECSLTKAYSVMWLKTHKIALIKITYNK